MKQLITDQLIKVSQDRIDAKKEYLKFQLSDAQRKVMLNDISNIEIFIRSLQSLREQEAQNVKDSYGDGLNAHRTNFCNRDDYFNQTFKQPQP